MYVRMVLRAFHFSSPCAAISIHAWQVHCRNRFALYQVLVQAWDGSSFGSLLASQLLCTCVCAVYFFLAFCTLQSQLPWMDLHLMSPLTFSPIQRSTLSLPKRIDDQQVITNNVGRHYCSCIHLQPFFSFLLRLFFQRERKDQCHSYIIKQHQYYIYKLSFEIKSKEFITNQRSRKKGRSESNLKLAWWLHCDGSIKTIPHFEEIDDHPHRTNFLLPHYIY